MHNVEIFQLIEKKRFKEFGVAKMEQEIPSKRNFLHGPHFFQFHVTQNGVNIEQGLHAFGFKILLVIFIYSRKYSSAQVDWFAKIDRKRFLI